MDNPAIRILVSDLQKDLARFQISSLFYSKMCLAVLVVNFGSSSVNISPIIFSSIQVSSAFVVDDIVKNSGDINIC